LHVENSLEERIKQKRGDFLSLFCCSCCTFLLFVPYHQYPISIYLSTNKQQNQAHSICFYITYSSRIIIIIINRTPPPHSHVFSLLIFFSLIWNKRAKLINWIVVHLQSEYLWSFCQARLVWLFHFSCQLDNFKLRLACFFEVPLVLVGCYTFSFATWSYTGWKILLSA
jgi:hypothetical protein